MTSTIVFCSILLGLAAMELVRAWLVRKGRRRYRHAADVERTRGRFAELRSQLLNLALSGRLGWDTATFKTLYTFYTFVMRRPDQYVQIGDRLWRLVVEHEEGMPSPLEDEASNWGIEVKTLVSATAEGLNLLMTEYSPWRRRIAWIERRTGAVTGRLRAVVAWILRVFVEWKSDMVWTRFDSARAQMLKMASI